MSKSSRVVYATLAAVCAVLLFFWFYLGFYVVDSPLDLVVAIVWWGVIAAAVYVTHRTEQHRRERVRTVYVGEAVLSEGSEAVPALFNSERGIVALDGRSAQDTTFSLIKDLEYGFGRKEFPEEETFRPVYLVRTSEFEPKAEQGEGTLWASDMGWCGEVVRPAGDRSLRWEFKSPVQLQGILSSI